MSWREQIFMYCERGTDPAFWAEPLNALSNGAFMLAALLAWRERSRTGGAGGRESAVLILIVASISVGSFLFHTFAERWSALADVVPIGLFMLVCLYLALDRLLALPRWQTALCLLAFLAACYAMVQVRCGGGACLRGSLLYFPAAAALLIMAGALALRRHPSARLVGLAAIIFPVSLTFRTLDMPLCATTLQAGTHFIWHLLNAVTLYLMLIASMRYEEPRPPD